MRTWLIVQEFSQTVKLDIISFLSLVSNLSLFYLSLLQTFTSFLLQFILSMTLWYGRQPGTVILLYLSCLILILLGQEVQGIYVMEWMLHSLPAAWSGLKSRWNNLGCWAILTTKSPHFLTTWQWSRFRLLLVGSLIASLLVWSGLSSLR